MNRNKNDLCCSETDGMMFGADMQDALVGGAICFPVAKGKGAGRGRAPLRCRQPIAEAMLWLGGARV